MSWDIFVQYIPESVKSIEDMPPDFKVQTIGRRSEIIAKILEVVNDADFTNPDWGTIDRPGFSIEISMGGQEEVKNFAFHVRGGGKAALLIADILNHLRLRAFDPGSATGIFTIPGESSEGFDRWQNYRDQVVGNTATNTADPKRPNFFMRLFRR